MAPVIRQSGEGSLNGLSPDLQPLLCVTVNGLGWGETYDITKRKKQRTAGTGYKARDETGRRQREQTEQTETKAEIAEYREDGKQQNRVHTMITATLRAE